MKNPVDVVRGRERCSVVFWLYCVIGTVTVILLFGMLVVSFGDRLSETGLVFFVTSTSEIAVLLVQ